MPAPTTLKELARTKGLKLTQLGIAGAYASMINVGHRRAGAHVIAILAGRLGETTERIAEICDACWHAAEARRAAASVPATSPAATQA